MGVMVDEAYPVDDSPFSDGVVESLAEICSHVIDHFVSDKTSGKVLGVSVVAHGSAAKGQKVRVYIAYGGSSGSPRIISTSCNLKYLHLKLRDIKSSDAEAFKYDISKFVDYAPGYIHNCLGRLENPVQLKYLSDLLDGALGSDSCDIAAIQQSIPVMELGSSAPAAVAPAPSTPWHGDW